MAARIILLKVTYMTAFAMITVLLVCYCQSSLKGDLSTIVSLSVAMITNTTGLASIVYLFKISKYVLTDTINREQSSGLKVVFTWIFGIGVLLHHSLYFIDELICLSEGKGNYFAAFMVRWFISIVFITIQLIFITISRKKGLINSGRVTSCTYGIALSNACMWVTATIADISHEFSSIKALPLVNKTHNDFNYQGSYCFWYSPIMSAINSIKDVVVPIQWEFQILAITFFLGFGKTIYERAEHANDYEQILTSRDEVSNNTSVRFTVWILSASTLFVLPVAIFNFTARIYNEGTSLETPQLLRYAYVMNTLLSAVALPLLIAGIRGCTGMSRSNIRHQVVGITDYVIIFTMAAIIGYYAFVLLSVFHTYDIDQLILTCLEYIIMSITILYQTIFILKMRRHQSFSWITVKSRKLYISLCTFIGIFNIYMWSLNTFFDLRSTFLMYDGGDLITNQTWLAVNRIVLPPAIYYRFHSSMELYALYQKLK